MIVPEQLLQLFPLGEIAPWPVEESDHTQKEIRLKQIQSDLLVQKSKPLISGGGSKVNRPGELYKRYRTVEELPATAKAFYELAGKSLPRVL